MNDRHAHFARRGRKRRFFDRFHAANLFEINVLQRFAGHLFDRVAQRRFHYAAGRSEDYAAAGCETQRHIKRLGLKLV